MKPARGVTILEDAIAERQAAEDRAGGLSRLAIPNGESLLAYLVLALQQSSAADHGFIGWIRDIANNGSCPINTATDSSRVMQVCHERGGGSV